MIILEIQYMCYIFNKTAILCSMIHENELRGDIVFSETLRKLRKNKKLNQAQLAKELYISPSAVSQYETGRTTPSRETLNRIAAYFNVSPEYLMGTSKIYEIEEMLNQEYYPGTTVSEALKKIMCVRGKDREALLTIVDALAAYSNHSGHL